MKRQFSEAKRPGFHVFPEARKEGPTYILDGNRWPITDFKRFPAGASRLVQASRRPGKLCQDRGTREQGLMDRVGL